MATDKRWSYRQVTEKAEARIRELLTFDDDDSRRLRQQWAYGVYLGWYNLTVGWQEDGDSDRLKAIAEGNSHKT
jgi:hypothetical protein